MVIPLQRRGRGQGMCSRTRESPSWAGLRGNQIRLCACGAESGVSISLICRRNRGWQEDWVPGIRNGIIRFRGEQFPADAR